MPHKPSPSSPEQYTCAQCGGTFDKVWSEEEAMSESVELWGEMDAEDLAVVCDDCFRIMTADPAAVRKEFRDSQAKMWRQGRAKDPKITRLIWKAERRAIQQLADAIWNAPTSDDRFGLQALLADDRG